MDSPPLPPPPTDWNSIPVDRAPFVCTDPEKPAPGSVPENRSTGHCV